MSYRKKAYKKNGYSYQASFYMDVGVVRRRRIWLYFKSTAYEMIYCIAK